MKPLLTLFVLFSVAEAEEQIGIFGPPDRQPTLLINVIGGGSSISLVTERKDAAPKYEILFTDSKANTTQPLTKEEFTACYLLACRAIREFRSSPRDPATITSFDLRSVSINAFGESVSLSYEAGSLKDNPLLQELLAKVSKLAKGK